MTGRPWVEPLVDVVAVELAAAGDTGVSLSQLELVAAVELLAGRGLNRNRIAVRLGCDHNIVSRLLRSLAARAAATSPTAPRPESVAGAA